MAETFPTNINPTVASQKKHQPRVKSIAFGNGYEQIAGDGLNSNKEEWSLSFILNDTNKQTVEDFFDTAGGYDYFNWTSPENGASEKQYLCKEWSINPNGAGAYTITCTFNEWVGLT